MLSKDITFAASGAICLHAFTFTYEHTLIDFGEPFIDVKLIPKWIKTLQKSKLNKVLEITSSKLYSCTVAPVVEEYMHRYYINQLIFKYINNNLLCTILGSIIFSAMHYRSYYTSTIKRFILINTFSGGIIYGTLYNCTNNIWTSILCHSLYNTLSYIFEYIGL